MIERKGKQIIFISVLLIKFISFQSASNKLKLELKSL
jgi:hypothetical protein